MSTSEKVVAAATALLDSGGEEAVTLRAVALASGVSHNAPYKHFENRDALLAAVAIKDFAMLRGAFQKAKESKGTPEERLQRGIRVMLEFNAAHPGRYRLLFNNASIAAAPGAVKQTAGSAFGEFVEIVKQCQDAGSLPALAPTTLTSLMFATMHGLLSMDSIGGIHVEKGLSGVESSLKILIELISPKRRGA